MTTIKSSQPPLPGFIRGSEVDISRWSGGELVLDSNHRVQCFLGYRRDVQPHGLPWYSPSVALHDRDGRNSFGFVELCRGVLKRSSFLQNNGYYKVIDDRHTILPRGTSSYFGVIYKGDKTEDEELTRKIFGGTMRDFDVIANALASTVGRSFHPADRLPRVTFSKTRENDCDITGCLIPREFPYIAFDDSQYDWGHVSLFGLYRLIAFMCSSIDSPVAKALEHRGISAELILRYIESGSARPIYARESGF